MLMITLTNALIIVFAINIITMFIIIIIVFIT